jgi:hypothetical protein
MRIVGQRIVRHCIVGHRIKLTTKSTEACEVVSKSE